MWSVRGKVTGQSGAGKTLQLEGGHSRLQLRHVTGAGGCHGERGIMEASGELRRAQDLTLRSPSLSAPTGKCEKAE